MLPAGGRQCGVSLRRKTVRTVLTSELWETRTLPRFVDALPKYRNYKASGQAFVTLNERDCYLGPHGKSESKAFYDRLIAEWLIQGRAAQAPTLETITVTVLCGR